MSKKLVDIAQFTALLLCSTSLFVSGKASASGTVSSISVSQNVTPFTATANVKYSGASITSAAFSIQPKSGSYTRYLSVNYSTNFLTTNGYLPSGSPTSGNLSLPILGLYAGTNNIINVVIGFSDGSTSSSSVPFSTAGYTDTCGVVNEPTIIQNRTATSQLGFDYFLLKDYCSPNSPAIFDTDGNIRWVGTAFAGQSRGAQASMLFGSYIYESDNKTGLTKESLVSNYAQKSFADYSNIGVTSTGDHNIDPGRNGMIIDISTTTEYEAADLEVDANGKVLNEWDLGQIISAAMTAGGDNPSKFVYADGKSDWFHNNATAYNPVDNTLIVSSRENFVIAVDYDPPADGSVRKIHWILGDTTKFWYSFPSLRKFALAVPAGTPVPVGQHAVSIDPNNHYLTLFNDGANSGFAPFQSAPGINRNYSTGDTYQINTSSMTASDLSDYRPSPDIYSSICGSYYGEPGTNTRLIDFATANNLKTAEIQGLGTSNQVIFDLKFPETGNCGVGWNAFPLTGQFVFN